jgi:hypothetical protein
MKYIMPSVCPVYKLLAILHFRLFLVAIVRYYYIELNRQIPYKLTSVQILKMQNGH